MSASRANRPEQRLELLGVPAGLLRGTHVGIGHDLHQGRTRAVEVDQADPLPGLVGGVDELGRVLLEMGPGDPDRDLALGRLERQPAVGGQRQVVLADLVALREVRIEVVLAVPAGRGRRVAPMATPVARTCSTALRLMTGSVPGRPRQTGRRGVFGGASAYVFEQPQNIFEAVFSWQWTSIPMTAS